MDLYNESYSYYYIKYVWKLKYKILYPCRKFDLSDNSYLYIWQIPCLIHLYLCPQTMCLHVIVHFKRLWFTQSNLNTFNITMNKIVWWFFLRAICLSTCALICYSSKISTITKLYLTFLFIFMSKLNLVLVNTQIVGWFLPQSNWSQIEITSK